MFLLNPTVKNVIFFLRIHFGYFKRLDNKIIGRQYLLTFHYMRCRHT